MRAAVLYEPNTPLKIEEVSLDGPRDGEVLVRVAATGACHSDYHVMNGDWHGPGFECPVVLGHEASGIVERVGAGVSGLKKGDHVILSFVASCGYCSRCSRGQPHLCTSMSGGPGAMYDGSKRLKRGDLVLNHFGSGMSSFAELSCVHPSQCVKVTPDLPLEAAALIGCAVMTGVGAVLNTAKVEPGATMAVFGTGGVGLSVVQGGVLANAGRIIAVDVRANKLQFARGVGATDTINAADADPVEAIKELTGGRGVDYAFDAIGLATVSRQCYDAVCRGGTAVVVGMAPTGQEIPIPATIAGQEKTVKGCFYGSARPPIDFVRLAQFYLSGRLKLDQMVSKKYAFTDINEAFAALARGDNARGVIVL
ncbi:MAG: Zn-dependent alcohol dehydrogenase [Chloroflexi bacterium]|nr:Zn-dependent alcohol dehydrogenase [Chloroflexota bacterium]